MSLVPRLSAALCCMLLALPFTLRVSEAGGAETASAAVPGLPGVTEYRLPPDTLAKATALYESRITMFVVGTIYGIAVLVLILFTRLNAVFRTWAERSSPRRFVQTVVFGALLFLTIDSFNLPVEIFRQHLGLQYGLSVQSWGSWAGDWLKNEAIATTIGILVVWGLYALIRRSPKRWWFHGSLALIPFVLLFIFIQPVFIAPLFDKFDPLEVRQPQLIPRLETVMQRGGLKIERSRMFEMRASDKETTYNAYVTGIGASKRVVVWDNTSRDLGIGEVLLIFGHEQGHYVLHHIWIGVGATIVALFVALYILQWCIGAVLRRWGPRWGIRDLSDLASLPVGLLIFSLLSVLAQPIHSAASRYLEHQADIYGLEVIHGLVPDSSRVAALTFQHLGEKGLSYPEPAAWYAFWVYDHPAIADRMRFAASYRPWETGKRGKYLSW